MTASRRCLLIVVTLVAAVSVRAARAAEPATAWVAASEAYAAGSYDDALRLFRQARAAGQAGPAIVYNIAVCEYRLRDYAAARASFAELDQRFPAMRPLAQYNLGLVALKLGNREEAADHFRSSYFLAGDDLKLRAMASTMLRRLVGESLPESAWLSFVSLRGGYDDNVILQDETGVASDLVAESPFVEVFGTLSGPYRGRDDGSAVRFDGGFLLLRYADVEEFDQSYLYVGGVHEWRRGRWVAELTAHAGTTTLGGDGFDRSLRIGSRLTYRLDASRSVALRYRYEDVSALDTVFDGIEGSRQRVDARYRWYDDGRRLHIGLTRESNDRADPGVSPDKTRLDVDYRYEPEVGWGYGIGGELRASEYGGIDPPRDEDLLQLELSVTRYTAAGWQWFARYVRADNDSSDPLFSYERNQLSVGVYRIF